MNPVLLTAIIFFGLILLLVLLLILGKAKIRIVCREKLRVVASVLGIRYTLISDKDPEAKKPRDLTRCLNPDRALRRELRRQRRESAKAWKKQLKAQRKAAQKAEKKQLQKQNAKSVPAPNIKEKLEMIFALLKQLYRNTNGKFRLHIRRMHIRVASDNAADTAVLYGIIMASTSCILQWLQDHFIPILRKEGSMQIQADYLSEKPQVDIDMTCSIRLYRALGIVIRMMIAYGREKRLSYQKANRRTKKAMAKAKANQAPKTNKK